MKFGNLNDWHTDPALELQGVPLDLGAGRSLIVRRAGTRNREFSVAVVGIDVTDAQRMGEVLARTVVIGWCGITDDHGEPIPFSPDACVAMFEWAPDVYEKVARFATERANFAGVELEEEKSAVKKRSGGARAPVHTRAS